MINLYFAAESTKEIPAAENKKYQPSSALVNRNSASIGSGLNSLNINRPKPSSQQKPAPTPQANPNNSANVSTTPEPGNKPRPPVLDRPLRYVKIICQQKKKKIQ
jgi:hypothetical protein